MTAAHYKGGHPPGNDLGLHYTALPPIVASCPYSDQLLVTRKFWSPGANRPSQARATRQSRPRLVRYRRATVLRGVVRTSLPTLGSMAPCSPPSRPLRAGSAGGLRPVLTAAVRGAGCGIAGRDGETGRGRTEKRGSRGRRGGELIAHPAVEHHHHLAHAGHQRHFGWLAAGRQPTIKLPDRTVAAHRAQRRHVQYTAHPADTPSDGA